MSQIQAGYLSYAVVLTGNPEEPCVVAVTQLRTDADRVAESSDWLRVVELQRWSIRVDINGLLKDEPDA